MSITSPGTTRKHVMQETNILYFLHEKQIKWKWKRKEKNHVNFLWSWPKSWTSVLPLSSTIPERMSSIKIKIHCILNSDWIPIRSWQKCVEMENGIQTTNRCTNRKRDWNQSVVAVDYVIPRITVILDPGWSVMVWVKWGCVDDVGLSELRFLLFLHTVYECRTIFAEERFKGVIKLKRFIKLSLVLFALEIFVNGYKSVIVVRVCLLFRGCKRQKQDDLI